MVFGSMKDYVTEEQMSREAEQLRTAAAASADGMAHAIFAENVREGAVIGDGDELHLEAWKADEGHYTVALTNGFHTFYLSNPDDNGDRSTKTRFSTPEEIVTEFPGLTWEAI